MRIEIISGEETTVHTLPEQVNFVGLTIEDTNTTLNISTGLPGIFENAKVECTDREHRLSERLTLTLHLYTLNGKASSLSWKPYPDFLFYDLHFAGIYIKVYG